MTFFIDIAGMQGAGLLCYGIAPEYLKVDIISVCWPFLQMCVCENPLQTISKSTAERLTYGTEQQTLKTFMRFS